jgi:predicted TIM-barrel fold metal-dependent hydrolase
MGTTFYPMDYRSYRVGHNSLRFPTVPVILGHLGGVNWMEAIALAKANRSYI